MAAILKLFFFASFPELKGQLTRKLVRSFGMTCRSKVAQIVLIGNPKWRPSWKSILNFFSWTERAIDSKFIGSIEVTCRSTVAKIVLIGDLRWSPFCLCLLYFPATVLFTCIKSWFFRNNLANFHQISHWSYCWKLMWLILCSNNYAPLTVMPIYSSSKLRTA